MKTKQILLTLGLIGCISLAGYIPSVAQDVQVYINLPYTDTYNNWTITFTNQSTGDQYTFYTDDDTFDPYEYAPLGTVPAGTYDIYFDSEYSGHFFDFGVITDPDYYEYQHDVNGYGDFTYHDAPIAEGSIVLIDPDN